MNDLPLCGILHHCETGLYFKLICIHRSAQVQDKGMHLFIISTILKGVPCVLAGKNMQVKAACDHINATIQPNRVNMYPIDIFHPHPTQFPYRHERRQLMVVSNRVITFMVCPMNVIPLGYGQ